MMWAMTTSDDTTNNAKFAYEAPSLQVVGTLQDITKSGALPNSDGPNGKNNANPNSGS